MVRNKLSDHDQMALVRLYRKSTLTATVLAEYYEVSPSTITRLLKEAIPEREYQDLVSQKRSLARRKDVPELGVEHVDEILQILDEETELARAAAQESAPDEAKEHTEPMDHKEHTDPNQPETLVPDPLEPKSPDLNGAPPSPIAVQADLHPPAGFTDPEAEEDEDEDEDDEDEDWEEEDVDFDPEVLHDLEEEIEHSPRDEMDEEDDYGEEDDDEDLDDDEDETEDSQGYDQGYEQSFEILPLEDLELPPLCFVVVDRFDELTTRPLQDFMPTDGGSPQVGLSVEMVSQAKTLPIFDNQRVARRFSQMSRRGNHPGQRNRVIQFPGYLLDVVRSQLQSKGITHLLVDGQVYSL